MRTLNQIPLDKCSACARRMKPEKAKNGGWCTRCRGCRRRNRRALHQFFRRRYWEWKRAGEEPGPYLKRYARHDCEKEGC